MLAAQKPEVVGHVEAPAGLGIGRHRALLVPVGTDLAHRRGAGIFVEQRAHAGEEIEILGPRLVVDVVLRRVRIHVAVEMGEAHALRHGRIVAKLGVVEVEVHGVEPEAVDAPLQPEAHDVQHRVLNRRVVEVQVGLRGEEVVQVVLRAAGVPFPGRAAEDGVPVVGRRAVGLRVGPDIPVGLGVGPVRPALGEPGVPVGGVREHEVDQDAQASCMRRLDQGVEII